MTFEAIDVEQLFNNHLLPWGLRFLFALLIFIIGRWIARRLSRFVRNLLQRREVHDLLRDFLSRGVYWLAMVVVVFAVLDQLGVDTTSALAIFGAAGLAVGFALKDSLSNVAAGMMIIFFHLFDSGDFIEAGGVSGTVVEVNLFNTRLLTPDNRDVIVPNSQIYDGPVTNYSANDTRRIDMTFGIADYRKLEDTVPDAAAGPGPGSPWRSWPTAVSTCGFVPGYDASTSSPREAILPSVSNLHSTGKTFPSPIRNTTFTCVVRTLPNRAPTVPADR